MAHNETFHQLGGVTLCLDERSVTAQLGTGDPSESAALARSLKSEFAALLTSYQVPFEQAEVCRNEGYLFSRFVTEVNTEGPEPVFLFTSALQVGSAPNDLSGSVPLLDNITYDAYDNWLAFESELDADAAFSGRENAAMLRELAGHWWTDNPAQRAARPWPLYLGAGAALLMGLLAWAGSSWLKRRKT